MARYKYAEPHVKWCAYVPQTLAAKVDLLLLDPFYARAKHGAKSELLQLLLQQWIDSFGAQAPTAQAPPDNTGLDKSE